MLAQLCHQNFVRFGVCCVFISNGGNVLQNCTYLQNPGFPAAYSGTSSVTYTLQKCNNSEKERCWSSLTGMQASSLQMSARSAWTLTLSRRWVQPTRLRPEVAPVWTR